MAKLPGPYQPLDGGNDMPLPRRPDDPPAYSEVDPTSFHSTAPLNLPEVPQIGFVDDPDRILRARSGTGSIVSTSNDDNLDSAAVVSRGIPLASKSIDVVCPHCKVEIRTSIEKKPGIMAYLTGAVMACLCCFCGCCLIPCCLEQCMEVKHTCPNCDGLIGKYRL